MSCRYKQYILPFILGELSGEKKNRLLQHLDHCAECKKLHGGYQFTGDLLKKRPFPKVPRGLERACRQATATLPSLHRQDSSGVRFIPRPVWQGALALGIFLVGLGAGKLVFDMPDSLKSWMPSRGLFSSTGTESRSIRSHLVSVEAFLLTMTNMKQEYSSADSVIDTRHIRTLLEKTRKFKSTVKDDQTNLFDLLTEIERVLDEILQTIEYGQMDLNSINESIQEQHLLPKIHSRTT